MRQIEKEMRNAVANAMNNGKDWKKGNTAVYSLFGAVFVSLHGNLIYQIDKVTKNGKFTLAGWNTPTTRSRLNALGVGVYQKNFEAYKDGQRLDVCEWYDVL